MKHGLAGEVIRYGVSGALLAALYSAVYWSLAALCGVPVLVANTIGFAVNLVAGWLIHSRWSFGNRRVGGHPAQAYAGFFIINFASYALNSLWVWLIVDRLHGSVTVSLVPVIAVTPVFTFVLNRVFIFRSEL